jgi:hypothetical protein
VVGGAEAYLDHVFGVEADRKNEWFDKIDLPWVWLNRRLLDARGLPAEAVEQVLAEWLRNHQEVVSAAYSRKQLAGPPLAGDPVALQMQKSFHPDRSGDLAVVWKPYRLLAGGLTGSNHGSPHPYDTHVPLLVYGAGVPKLGKRGEATSSLVVAPIVARALDVPAPPDAEEKVPEALVK